MQVGERTTSLLVFLLFLDWFLKSNNEPKVMVKSFYKCDFSFTD